MEKEKEKKKITAVVRYAWYLGACGYCSETWILFCVWWWFPMLECSGVSAVRGKGGRGFYGRWVFMRVSDKICVDVKSFKCVQVGSFFFGNAIFA